MLSNLLAAVASVTQRPFQHRWLSHEFVAESKEQARGLDSKKHHYVPEFYLRGWAEDGLVQPYQVDSRSAHVPQPPGEIGHKRNLYTLPETGDTMDLPLRWVEKHLSRIEGECAVHLKWLATREGLVEDHTLKRDVTVFLAFQLVRTLDQRERNLTLVQGPPAGKREYLRRTNPGLSPAQIEERMRPKYQDPKHEAIHLMMNDVEYGVAHLLNMRKWAVYRTVDPIITCDEPVIQLAGPPCNRQTWIAGLSASVLYPLDPHHLLVLLRWDLSHRGPFVLGADDTKSINLEIMAAATKATFERPSDQIFRTISVPPRPSTPELDAETVDAMDGATALHVLLSGLRRHSRWTDLSAAPEWPVLRWYQPS
ncbi:DUF4238 domain-containing protein [Nocardia testacea]|uniref:DUF4238 domain-containing protein n=1 Tax=Nocardia testacea TaxID=248551 RepID=UPI0012F6E23D